MLPKLPERELVQKFLESKHINEELLNEHLSGLTSKLLESIAARDYKTLEGITEKRMFNKLMSQKETLEKFELKLETTNP